MAGPDEKNDHEYLMWCSYCDKSFWGDFLSKCPHCDDNYDVERFNPENERHKNGRS